MRFRVLSERGGYASSKVGVFSEDLCPVGCRPLALRHTVGQAPHGRLMSVGRPGPGRILSPVWLSIRDPSGHSREEAHLSPPAAGDAQCAVPHRARVSPKRTIWSKGVSVQEQLKARVLDYCLGGKAK